jgi:hypothetical protein
VVISVALDTAGVAAAREWTQPVNIDAYPKWIWDLMGWDATDGNHASAPDYPCLIDEEHILSELYNIINVPMAVWIDERGRIVRPMEPAGASDAFRTMDRKTLKMPQDVASKAKLRRRVYVHALQDWVEKGEKSIHALSPEEARRRMRGPSEADVLAAANFRLGVHLFKAGHFGAAQQYFAEARRLRPTSWSYRRQSWELEQAGKAAGPEFWSAVDQLGNTSFYPPIQMDGMPE